MKFWKQNQKGMTLVELIVAIALGTILVTMAAIAVVTTFQLTARSTALAEGGTLRSTLYHTIADELRYAQLDDSAFTTDGELSYSSPLHAGQTVKMTAVDGHLMVNGLSALSNSTYVGYELTGITFAPLANGCLEVKYRVEHPLYDTLGDETRVVIRNLN